MNEVKAFETIRHLSLPEELHTKLSEFESLHLVLIAPEYSQKQIKTLLDIAKKNAITANAAFILLLDSNDPKERTAWQECGIDGFLVPPYTVDTFSSLASMTNKIIRERGKSKRRMVMTNKLETFITQLNLVALNTHTESKDLPLNRKLLKHLGKGFGIVHREDLDMYLDVLLEVMTNPDRQRSHLGYNGASNRLRRKFEKKLEEQVAYNQTKSLS